MSFEDFIKYWEIISHCCIEKPSFKTTKILKNEDITTIIYYTAKKMREFLETYKFLNNSEELGISPSMIKDLNHDTEKFKELLKLAVTVSYAPNARCYTRFLYNPKDVNVWELTKKITNSLFEELEKLRNEYNLPTEVYWHLYLFIEQFPLASYFKDINIKDINAVFKNIIGNIKHLFDSGDLSCNRSNTKETTDLIDLCCKLHNYLRTFKKELQYYHIDILFYTAGRVLAETDGNRKKADNIIFKILQQHDKEIKSVLDILHYLESVIV